MPNTTIRIKENSFANDVFTLTVRIHLADDNEFEEEVLLHNPYDAQTDALLEWYFEQYISTPYDDVKVEDAVQAIGDYGSNLFQKILTDKIPPQYLLAIRKSKPEDITIEIVGD